MTDWRSVKRAATRAEADLAVQGWLCVFLALGVVLAALVVF